MKLEKGESVLPAARMLRTPNFAPLDIFLFKKFWEKFLFTELLFLRYLQSFDLTSQIPKDFYKKTC